MRVLAVGFGLIRIDAIIERLDGYLSRNSEDGAFTTEILIPQVYVPAICRNAFCSSSKERKIRMLQ